MNKKIFKTVVELKNFINDFSESEKYIFDIQELKDNQGFLLQWQVQKYYTDFHGVVRPEEGWITADGDFLQIQDISEEHLKNILRMIIRTNREYAAKFEKEMYDEYQELLNSNDLDDQDSITIH